MNNRRKLIIALGAGVLTAPFRSFAQQPVKVWRIGFLGLGSRQSSVDVGRFDALVSGLREFGYVEGKNLVLERRFADNDAGRLDGLAAELVRLKVDVILASTSVETVQKCVELLRTMLPKLSRLAVMGNPTDAANSPMLLSVQLLMQRLGGWCCLSALAQRKTSNPGLRRWSANRSAP